MRSQPAAKGNKVIAIDDSEDGENSLNASYNDTVNRNDNLYFAELDGMIGFHLRLAQDVSFRIFSQTVGRDGLKVGHFAALKLIDSNPGISQIALSRAIARDKSTVTPLIQSMEKDGLIERKRSNEDRRSVLLHLTRQGREMLHELMLHAQEHDQKLDQIVGDSKTEFIELLRKIADSLE